MRRINRKPNSQGRTTKVVWSGIAGVALLAVARALAAVPRPGESGGPAGWNTTEVIVTAPSALSTGSSKGYPSGSELLGPTAPSKTVLSHQVAGPSGRRIIVTISERKLALVEGGKARHGSRAFVSDPLRKRFGPVEIVSNHFYDPDGSRMHG